MLITAPRLLAQSPAIAPSGHHNPPVDRVNITQRCPVGEFGPPKAGFPRVFSRRCDQLAVPVPCRQSRPAKSLENSGHIGHPLVASPFFKTASRASRTFGLRLRNDNRLGILPMRLPEQLTTENGTVRCGEACPKLNDFPCASLTLLTRCGHCDQSGSPAARRPCVKCSQSPGRFSGQILILPSMKSA
jgi:hypothetical protein